MRGATLPYMLFRILLVSSDEMPLRPSKRNNGTCDYRPLGTEECERSLCFFLGHYTSTCCRQYSFLFLNSLQYVEMDAINVYAATKFFFIALFRGFACFFFKYAGFILSLFELAENLVHDNTCSIGVYDMCKKHCH